MYEDDDLLSEASFSVEDDLVVLSAGFEEGLMLLKGIDE